jgi:DNA-directed RNA polymerase delta subunit
VSRLTNKTNESLKTISKLRETTIPEADYNKILQQNYHLKDQLLEADERATLAEDEIFTFKEQNAKLSKQVTKLMIALNNSNSSQDALEKQISDNAALDNNLVLAAKGATPRQLTRKELKKLRQKTKKILVKLQDNENNETHEDESNLNESVENLTDPNQNSLNTNGSDDDRDTASDNCNDSIIDTSTFKAVTKVF